VARVTTVPSIEGPPVRLKYLGFVSNPTSVNQAASTIRNVRVVRHVDGRLIGAANQLRLVLNPQHNHLLAVLHLLANGVHHARLDGAGETLIAVLADQRELDALATLETLHPRNLPHADGGGPVPDLLAPADDAAVQVVRPVVGGQCVGLAAVDVLELGVLDAVGDAADGLAEEGGVVALVLRLLGEALHDVDAADAELLDDGAQGQEGDGCVGHFCGGCWGGC
jgi:hypothetical protein